MADSALETSIKDYAWGRIDPARARDMRSLTKRSVVRDRVAGMVDSIHEQLEERPDDYEWRGGVLRLLGRLEDMLAEFNVLCDDEAMRLRAAIERHRADVLATEKPSEDADAELWAVLDG